MNAYTAHGKTLPSQIAPSHVLLLIIQYESESTAPFPNILLRLYASNPSHFGKVISGQPIQENNALLVVYSRRVIETSGGWVFFFCFGLAFCSSWESQEGRSLPEGISRPSKQPSAYGGWAGQGSRSNKLKPGRKRETVRLQSNTLLEQQQKKKKIKTNHLLFRKNNSPNKKQSSIQRRALIV